MLSHATQSLLAKIACALLAALVLQQVTRVVTRTRPLRHASLPEVPTWSPPTNAASTSATANAPAAPSPQRPMPPRPPRGPFPPGMPQPGNPGPELPPDVQARLDRIVQSGILGPVIRPPPTALLGIAGPDVFLRGPNGQTGLLRVGEELGGVTLLRIGTNRVLVREAGQEKELTIFNGLGGDPLPSTPNPPLQ